MNSQYYAIIDNIIVPEIEGDITWELNSATTFNLTIPAHYIDPLNIVGKDVLIFWNQKLIVDGFVDKTPEIDFKNDKVATANISCLGGLGFLSRIRAKPNTQYTKGSVAYSDILRDLLRFFQEQNYFGLIKKDVSIYYNNSSVDLEAFILNSFYESTSIPGSPLSESIPTDIDLSNKDTLFGQIKFLLETYLPGHFIRYHIIYDANLDENNIFLGSGNAKNYAAYDLVFPKSLPLIVSNEILVGEQRAILEIGNFLREDVVDINGETNSFENGKMRVAKEGENLFDIKLNFNSSDIYDTVEPYAVINDYVFTVNFALDNPILTYNNPDQTKDRLFELLEDYPITYFPNSHKLVNTPNNEISWCVVNKNLNVHKSIRKKFDIDFQVSSPPTDEEKSFVGYLLYLKTVDFLRQSENILNISGKMILQNNNPQEGDSFVFYFNERSSYVTQKQLNISDNKTLLDVNGLKVRLNSVKHKIGDIQYKNNAPKIVYEFDSSETAQIPTSLYDSELELYKQIKQEERAITYNASYVYSNPYTFLSPINPASAANATIFSPTDAFEITFTIKPGSSVPAGATELYPYIAFFENNFYDTIINVPGYRISNGIEYYIEYVDPIPKTSGLNQFTIRITSRQIVPTVTNWDWNAYGRSRMQDDQIFCFFYYL